MKSKTSHQPKDPAEFFSIRKPCANCPFRKDDQSINLAEGRREEIIDEMLIDGQPTFPCHKTVYTARPQTHVTCAGAIAVCKNIGVTPQMVQMAERMGVITTDHYDDARSLVMDMDYDLHARRTQRALARTNDDN